MADPTYPHEAYLVAFDIVRSISENLAIQFQIEGEKWDRGTMQKHVNSRGALFHVQNLILDEGERISKCG